MKIIEEDDEDAFKGGSSDKVGKYCFTIKYHCGGEKLGHNPTRFFLSASSKSFAKDICCCTCCGVRLQLYVLEVGLSSATHPFIETDVIFCSVTSLSAWPYFDLVEMLLF